MHWDLGLPLLVMLATVIVGVLIYFCARALVFGPREDDRIDDGS